MLLTISTTHVPATDLGYLLYKHPDRVQTFPLTFGQAHVFYSEATVERCTAALLLDINPVALVRRDGGQGFALSQYVNDRAYVASSFLSVAIAQVFGSALAGTCRDRPALAETAIPLEATVAVLPCRGGEGLLRRLFEPLGYTVTAIRHGLDETFPDWGESPYFTVTLSATTRLQDLLSHLYVLIPVLDDDKHYYVGHEEIEKLLRHGEGWLAAHPEREVIVQRYLRHQRSLKRAALAQLVEQEAATQEEDECTQEDAAPETVRTPSLHQQRLEVVVAALKASGAQRVLDLGCGEGRLLALLLKERAFTAILGADVTYRALELAAERLRLDRLPPKQRERIQLLHSSLVYRDPRLAGYDAAAVVEVIEHIEPDQLPAFERALFAFARPQTVVITTPNVEYNVKWEGLAAGRFRHRDHRFEWSRAGFAQWAQRVAGEYGYSVEIGPIGPEDAEVGAPSQIGVFRAESPAEVRSEVRADHSS